MLGVESKEECLNKKQGSALNAFYVLQMDDCLDLVPDGYTAFDDEEDIAMNLEPCGSLSTGGSCQCLGKRQQLKNPSSQVADFPAAAPVLEGATLAAL